MKTPLANSYQNKCSNKSKLGFSLIELSIVILVIGILVAGIIKGSTIMRSAKLKSAQSLTESSPVASIDKLAAWFETSNDQNIASGSAGSGTYGNIADGSRVTAWRESHPQSSNKLIISAVGDSNRPNYVANGINGLPSLSFDGVAYYLASVGITPLFGGNDNFTYIVVWQKDVNNATTGVIFEQNNNAAAVNGVRAGFIASGSGGYGFVGQNNDYSSIAYKKGKPYLSVMSFSSAASNNANFYTNSKNTVVSATLSASLANVSTNIFTVGANGRVPIGEFYAGLISEIIVFNKVLSNSERNSVIDYLSSKYNLVLQ